MVGRRTKLIFQKRVKRTKKNVEQAQTEAVEHLDKHIVRRWKKFAEVRRFVIGWLALVLILAFGVITQRTSLAQYYQEEVPAAGGTYIEGVVSKITNLNPIFASTSSDRASSKLIFNGLVKYDETSTVSPDLAKSWTVNKDETIYTFELRDDVFWHDGAPFTAKDVVYTFEAIQHPDTRSPLNQSWRDITVQATGDYTVTFTLPNPFTPFIHSLVVGILPSHLLEELSPNQLRAAKDFNLAPIGTGPFKFEELFLDNEVGRISMLENKDYFLGRPLLGRFVIVVFSDHEKMLTAFQNGELSAAAGLRTSDIDQLGAEGNWTVYDLPLFNNTFAFFNNSDDRLKNKDIRKALVYATDRDAIFQTLDMRAPISSGPLLNGQLGFDPDIGQLPYNTKKAAALLEKAGWKLGSDGLRHKAGKVLEFTLVTQNSDEYPAVAAEMQRQWKEVGVVLKPELVSGEDLQQSHIVPHSYEILLLGVSLGIDPDVFVYWHSSQAQVGGFNLAEYENDVVDQALEAGRTRLDAELREAKYATFLEQWVADVPSLALYRPTFHYAQLNVADGFNVNAIVAPSERYESIDAWTIKTEIKNKPY